MRLLRFCFICLFLNCIPISPAFSWPSIFPTGTTYYDPKAAYNSYTLFAPMMIKTPFGKEFGGQQEPAVVHLINMNGEEVHRWTIPFSPLGATLLNNGNLLVIGQYNDPAVPIRPGWGKWFLGGAAGRIVEMDWEGKIVFEHVDPRMHHDVVKLKNGHYLYLDWERVPVDLVSKVRGGITGTEFPNDIMFNDRLVEVDAKGKVVWEWHANEHLNPDIDIIGPLYKRNEWCHGNSVDVLPDGNILLTSRSLDSLITIDKSTGKILSRWGSGHRLNKKGEIESVVTDESLGSPHDGTVIPAGSPGAGNFLCFSNRTTNGDFMYSRTVEVDPKTRKLAWGTAMRSIGRKDFSDYLGGAQRLPNGNTLICDGANGRLYQTTSEGQTVWEFVNPFLPSLEFRGAFFTARAYAPDHCPQFKKLPAAIGPAVTPLDNRQFRVADLYKDRYPWRWNAMIGLACALLASVAFNIYWWQKRGMRRVDSSST